MILVDTSAWVEQLRPRGRADVRSRVEQLLRTGEAAWCPIVRLELWNGARGAHEQKVLSEMVIRLPELEINEPVWNMAYELARKTRISGFTIPPQDILVASCAKFHGVAIEHADGHFDQLLKL